MSNNSTLSRSGGEGQIPRIHTGATLEQLRQQVARIERRHVAAARAALSLGASDLQECLAEGGLAVGTLHEILADSHADRSSAVGFAATLMAAALAERPGHAFFVSSKRAFRELGRPCGQGLRQVGIDPARLVLVEAGGDKDALWALEEILRSEACPAMAVGAVAGGLDLTTTRRLNLAAEARGCLLAVLRTAREGASAAATRWKMRSLPAARDASGSIGPPRWRAVLERSRNGKPGSWNIEWTNVTHRFRLAEGMADRASSVGAPLRHAV